MGKKQPRFRLWAGTALGAGLLLRLWFIAHEPRIGGDTFLYGDIAKNLLQHGVYGFSVDGKAPRPTLIRLPGYPLFLAACFRLFGVEHYRAVLTVQALADLLTCGLASALAGRIFGRRATLPVLWLAALCPFTANYVAAGLAETLSLTCIALTFYGMARWQDAGAGFNRWLWVVAATLAYAIFLRPDLGLLAAAVLPAMLWIGLQANGPGRAFRAAPVLAAAVCIVLPLVPWTARNWQVFHVFQPLAPRYANDPGELVPLGFQRWYRTWAIEYVSTETVYWNYDGSRVEVKDLPRRALAMDGAGASAGLYQQTAALLDDYNRNTTGTPALDARFAALAAERIHAAPLRYYVLLPAARVLNMLLRPRVEMMPIELEWWKWSQHRAQTAFAAAYAVVNFGYLMLGLAGLWAWQRGGLGQWRPLAWAMAASILLRCALLLTVDNSEPRYTLEFFPVLLAWAGGWFVRKQRDHPAEEGA